MAFKLKYDKLSTNTLNFKLIPKKHRVTTDNKKVTKLLKGVVIIINGEYFLKIKGENLKGTDLEEKYSEVLYLPFTEESYNLKGRTSVWDRTPDKYGKYVRYIRDDVHARCHPGSPERYVPFCKNWVCSGHIVRHNGKLMFNFNECIAPEGYDVLKIKEDEE